jgi:hypothetical protein
MKRPERENMTPQYALTIAGSIALLVGLFAVTSEFGNGHTIRGDSNE